MLSVLLAVSLSAKQVAFTFDDGPSADSAKLLDILGDAKIHATFFEIGQNQRSYLSSAKLIFSKGHELGNHGDNYDGLGNAAESTIRSSLQTVVNQLKDITGEAPKYFRAPNLDYGSGTLARVAGSLGLALIGTDVIGQDWNPIPAQTIASNVQRAVHDGGIILLHENPSDGTKYEQTRQAVKILIPWLTQQGYTIGSVSELAAAKGKTLVPGTRYDSIQ
jgi:peptidoglycan/xylan/chitin deacetylase (PgdA/CDA1 family)